MRIFIAVEHEPLPGNRLWHTNLHLPLIDLGHDVIPFRYDLSPHFANADPADPAARRFIETHRARLEQALLRQVARAHADAPIDVFLAYFYSAFCRPDAIREIRAMGICALNWYCNASYQFHLVRELAPAFDYCLVPERFRLDDYRAAGANPIYCQEAANPAFYRPLPLPREFDVTFVGRRYGDRAELLRHLLDHGIAVRVWGQGWNPRAERTPLERLKQAARRLLGRAGPETTAPEFPPGCGGPPLDDAAMVALYSRSKINLGFSSCGETHRAGERILQVRLRDFEVPMSGGFYVVEFMEELAEHFEIGREIVCYRNRDELLDRVRYYLAHDEERERIREAGYRRAQRDHTWQKRLATVFQRIREDRPLPP